MKKLFISIMIALIVYPVYAEKKEYQSPMSLYNDNYFITGDKDDEQVKFQFSAKYNLLYPFNTGIYFGYTQRSWWKIYDKSSPFVETNYMPEIFLRFESGDNIVNDVKIPLVDYVQISPIFHKSNGQQGDDSRSINTYYGQIQVSYGEQFNIGTNVKIFGYYNKSSKNKDIEKYIGYYEADIFFKIRSKDVLFFDKEELHFKFGGFGTSDYNTYKEDKKVYGWYCVEAQFRFITSRIQPKFFVQYYNGYSEWLINYNEKEESFRIGMVF